MDAYNLTVEAYHTFFVAAPDNDNAPAVWVHNICFGNLRDHALLHGPALGAKTIDDYFSQAAKHLASGTAFNFRHDGPQKIAHLTRLTGDNFMFTSSTPSGSRIFTHMAVDQQYLRNIGITLPKGF